jgi:hypothetical protein
MMVQDTGGTHDRCNALRPKYGVPVCHNMPARSHAHGCAIRPHSHRDTITVATRTTDWWPPHGKRAGQRPDARCNRRKTPPRKTGPRRLSHAS